MSDFDYNSQLRAIEAQNTAMIQSYFGTGNNTSKSSTPSILPSSSSTTFGNLAGSLGDYGLMRSGSYSKLVKAYYNNMNSSAEESSKATTGLVNARDMAKNLKTSAESLSHMNFDKVKKTTKDDDGNETTTTDYDRDSLYKAAKEFVSSYNEVLDSAVKVDNESVLRRALSMTKRTEISSNLLKDVGIKVGDDNKLSIDEDTFKKADMSVVKTLFKGSNSYASRVASDASSIANISGNAASKASGNRSYSADGSYTQVNTSSMYDSLT
jgi:hypothetical protein